MSSLALKTEVLERKKWFWAYLFIAPACLLILCFNLIPLFTSFIVSTLDMQISFAEATFVGLRNFKEAFTDWRFINGIKVTLRWTFTEVPVQMVVGLTLSSILAKNSLSNRVFRAIYFIPIVCSATAIGVMFRIILHSSIGIYPYWLRLAGFGRINFLGEASSALLTVVFVAVWRNFGISTIILVAAMQNVPKDYYDAAETLGAGKLRQFFQITLPTIMPSFWFLLMTRVIGSLQVFDLVYTLTGGGPNYTTETLVSYVYTKAFNPAAGTRMGYATAMSEFLFVIIMTITLIQYTIMRKTED